MRLIFALIFTMVVWSSAFPGIRAALAGGYPPTHLVLLRFLVASAFFGVLALCGKIRLPRRADLKGIALTGFLAVAVYQLALNYGEQTVEAGAASLLINSAPIWTSLLASLVLKERLVLRQWLGVLVGFGGVMLIVSTTSGNHFFSFGALLVLLAALAHSSGFIVQKPILAHYTAVEFGAYEMWAGTLFLLPFSHGLITTLQTVTPQATLSVVYLGIGPAALAFATWAYVLGRMPAYRAASFLYFVPACTIVISWFWLGEVPSPMALIGGLFAIGGVILVNKPSKIVVIQHA